MLVKQSIVQSIEHLRCVLPCTSAFSLFMNCCVWIILRNGRSLSWFPLLDLCPIFNFLLQLNAMGPAPNMGGRVGKKGKKLPSTRPIPTNKARVILLDGEELDIPVDKKAPGREIFDRVCDHQSIEERDYFGLTYVNRKEQTWFWLDMDKKISKQLKSRCLCMTLKNDVEFDKNIFSTNLYWEWLVEQIPSLYFSRRRGVVLQLSGEVLSSWAFLATRRYHALPAISASPSGHFYWKVSCKTFVLRFFVVISDDFKKNKKALKNNQPSTFGPSAQYRPVGEDAD